MQKKFAKKLLESRYLKALTAKIKDFKNAVVLLYANKTGDKNDLDISDLRELAKKLDALESSGSYFIIGQDVGVSIYDKSEIKNKDLIVTISHNGTVDMEKVREDFEKAFDEARSIRIVDAEVDEFELDF